MSEFRRARSCLGFLGAIAVVVHWNPLSLAAADCEYPLAVGVAKDGTIYVADRYLPGVWKVRGGKPEVYFKGEKKFRTPLNAPRCLGFDKEGRLLVGDSATRDIYFSPEGKAETVVKGRPFSFPHEVVLNKDGVAYVSDGYAKSVWKIPASGSPSRWVEGKPLVSRVGTAWKAAAGPLLIIDPHVRQLFAADAAGKITAVTPSITKP